MNLKNLFKYTAIIFAIALVIELIAVQVIDYRLGHDSIIQNVAIKMVGDLDETKEDSEEKQYCGILDRELTKEEAEVFKIAQVRKSIVTYSNIGVVMDAAYGEDTLFLDEDVFYLTLRYTSGETRYTNVFTLKNDEIMEKYRSYWKDKFYSFDKGFSGAVESYRYYQLVFDSFYLDDMTIVPERVSIYKVERIPVDGTEYSEITNCELMETMDFDVTKEGHFLHYEIAQELDQWNIDSIGYDYTCDGKEGFSVQKDCTLNGKYFSLEERKALLAEILEEKHASQKRDLVGFSKYYYSNTEMDSVMLDGKVRVLTCESNILHDMWRTLWMYIIPGALLQFAVALGCAAIILTIITGRKKE
ncbi:MAG: hypothetical protein E7264_04500 [Lachnospiraceae bacterium]|nr:hypothetical protein [Lachnospiraceae bacterium]